MKTMALMTYQEMMEKAEAKFQELIKKDQQDGQDEQEVVTLTRGQLKGLMQEVMQEATSGVKTAVTEAMAERDAAQKVTREQIMSIKDRTERQQMIKKHPELFKTRKIDNEFIH